MKMDFGVRLLYLIYGRAVGPHAIKNIQHELIKASPLFYHLNEKGINIDKMVDALSQDEPHEHKYKSRQII